MLNALRDNLKSTWLKFILLLTGLGLIGYLGAYCGIDYSRTGGPGGRGGWIARVNGEEVSLREFQGRARIRADNYRRLLGQEYDPARLTNEIMGELVRREIMCQEARKAGLSVSPQETADRIFQSFSDPQGNFVGTAQYEQSVRRNWGIGTETFEAWLHDDVLADKWQDLITQPVRITEAEVEELYRARTEKTAMDYVVVASADQEDDLETTEAEVRAWYDAHQEDYRRSAGRKIRYVTSEYQAMLDGIAVAEEEIAEFYSTNQATYQRPEQRRARHILFRIQPDASDADKQALREKAEGVLERVRGGEDFAGLAVAMSEDQVSAASGGDLNFFSREEMVPAFSNAAFDTPVGELAPVVESVFGFHVIQVTDSRPAGVAPLDEKREEIRQLLRTRQAQQQVRDQIERLAAVVTSADDFASAAAGEGLEVLELDVREGDPLSSLGPSPAFSDAVFQLAPGSVSQPLGVSRGQALLVVDAELPSEIAPIEDVASQVKADLLNQRLRDIALQNARRAFERRGSFEAAAKALKLEIRESGDLASEHPRLPATGGTSPELRDALFGEQAAAGDEGVVPVPAGALIYRVTRRDPFDRELFEDSRDTLRAELVDRRRIDVLNQHLSGLLQGAYSVEYNMELLAQFTGQDRNPPPAG
jgi:peptidyl-prolyl cis-trans isomerase D